MKSDKLENSEFIIGETEYELFEANVPCILAVPKNGHARDIIVNAFFSGENNSPEELARLQREYGAALVAYSPAKFEPVVYKYTDSGEFNSPSKKRFSAPRAISADFCVRMYNGERLKIERKPLKDALALAQENMRQIKEMAAANPALRDSLKAAIEATEQAWADAKTTLEQFDAENGIK